MSIIFSFTQFVPPLHVCVRAQRQNVLYSIYLAGCYFIRHSFILWSGLLIRENDILTNVTVIVMIYMFEGRKNETKKNEDWETKNQHFSGIERRM